MTWCPSALLAVMLLTACRGPVRDVAPADGPSGSPAEASGLRQETAALEGEEDLPEGARRALGAIRGGRYSEARTLLGELIVAEAEDTARAAIAAGRPLDALAVLDEALALAPDDPELLFERGRAASDAAAGDPNSAGFLYAEAQAAFEAAARGGRGVAAAFAASHAARLAGDGEAALDIARQAVEWVDVDPKRRDGLALEQPLERTWGEATFDAYIAARGAGQTGEARALFAETEEAFGRLIGRQPDDPWAYHQLANLFLWEGRTDEAIARVEQALTFAPEDEETHTTLARMIGDQAAARATADGADAAAAQRARRAAVIARYEDFRAEHPENALGYWFGGFESFYAALEAFEAGQRDEAAFASAERLFRSCRELNPEYTESSRGYEVMCRDAIGWCRYWADDLDGAREAFLSMEGVVEGGLDWSLNETRADGTPFERLPSGLAGLDFVTRKYAAPENAADVDSMSRAAAIADTMHALRPEHPNLANNAGFLNRDAAVLYYTAAIEKRGELEAAEISEQRAELEAEARRLRARAQELMERSYAAYQVAARLAPDDVRVVNDAGLVMAYYLRTDPAAAETYFLDSVADGEVQLRDLGVDDPAHADLNEAWGDAHQNLGILYMTIENDPAKARPWFVKSVEIGPPTRDWIRSQLLPALDEWIESGKKGASIEELERTTVWTDNP